MQAPDARGASPRATNARGDQEYGGGGIGMAVCLLERGAGAVVA